RAGASRSTPGGREPRDRRVRAAFHRFLFFPCGCLFFPSRCVLFPSHCLFFPRRRRRIALDHRTRTPHHDLRTP
ncbi:MAG: hypothetical protein ACK462_08320, partial [Planctomyces sp.]